MSLANNNATTPVDLTITPDRRLPDSTTADVIAAASATVNRCSSNLGVETAHRHRSRSRSPVQEESGTGDTDDESNTGQVPPSNPIDQAEMLSQAQQRLDNMAASYANSSDQFMIFIQGGSDGVHQTLVLFADDRRASKRNQTQHRDAKLVYYVEEPNMGRGFIKEPCFSNDGRVICSPFAHGVRLLGFDSECNQVEDGLYLSGSSSKARELQEVASVYSHQNLVVATKYSPTHQLLVTGCLDGQVGFHQPLL